MFREKYKAALLLLSAVAMLCSCMDYGPADEEDFDLPDGGVFIVCEGNLGYGNASLSYYIPSTGEILNDVFGRANGANLGDVAQSMVVRDGLGYITVNNSGIVFVIDIANFKVRGEIKPMTSPRYIHFLSDNKAYVTRLWDTRISIVDPRTLEITGHIETGIKDGIEQMVQWGKYVFTNCWNYNDRILVIDIEADEVVGEIEVGLQPASIALDSAGKIWTLTDGGGYEGNPYGHEAPALYRIDAQSRAVEKVFTFALGDAARSLCLDGAGGTLYFINGGVWRMDVTAETLPAEPFIEDRGTIFYGLAVDPATGEVYIADAIDHRQPGIVYRYSPGGELLDSFKVGIIPGFFCFK